MEELDLTVFITGPRRFKQEDKCLAYRCLPTVFDSRVCEVLCLTVCVLSAAMSHGVVSCRQEESVEKAVFVTPAGCYSHGAFVRHYPHFNYNAAWDNPFFCPLFWDILQVAGEGDRHRSPEFCPSLKSFRRSIQGKTLSDSLTFCLQKCVLPSCVYLQMKVPSQFVIYSFILWEAAAGISYSKFREQTKFCGLRWVYAEAYSLRVFMMSLLDNLFFFSTLR